MFAYQESMNVVQAIALAGGFTGLAEENYVTVTVKKVISNATYESRYERLWQIRGRKTSCYVQGISCLFPKPLCNLEDQMQWGYFRYSPE